MLIRAALCFFLFSPLHLVARSATDSPFSIERIDAFRWRLTVRNDLPRFRTVHAGSDTYSSVEIPGYRSLPQYGSPAMPFKRFEFGVPPKGTVHIKVTSSDIVNESRSLLAFRPDEYNAPKVQEHLAVSYQSSHVGLQRAIVEFMPALYDAQRRSLSWVKSLTAEITISAPDGLGVTTTSTEIPDVINATDAVHWASPATPMLLVPGWYQPGEDALRISILRDGIYRITKTDAMNAGMNPDAVDPRTVRLMYRGNEEPITFQGEADGRWDEGDFIEFFAMRRYGENGAYYDFWSDENIMFLLWGGAIGKRHVPIDARPGSEPLLSSYKQRLHFEREVIYHAGDNDFEQNDSEYVFGEGWVWKYLLKKDTLVVPFEAPDLGGGDATLLVRLKGSSRDVSLVRLSINGTIVSEFDIQGWELMTRKETLAAGLLKDGSNTLIVTSVGKVACPPENPNCSIERFYVDWVECIYPMKLRASNELYLDAAIGYDSTAGPESRRVIVSGFSNPEITVLNRTTGERLANTRITSSGSEYSVECVIITSDSYVFFTSTAVQSPAKLSRITLPLSAGTVEPDYIILTHKSFRPAAERLASYRNTTDGYETLIAEVDDLYLEYNFGLKHPRAMKDFVRSIYERATKKPRFLLILGDASWDPKSHHPAGFKKDIVPTYGNPANDNYFVALGPDENNFQPLLHVGRIPCETLDQAHDVIDKIVEYESAPPQDWNNRVLFSIGGKTKEEQDRYFLPGIKRLTNTWVNPYCLEPRTIIKKSLDLVSYDDLDTLRWEMNNGVLWYYFVGHGGTRIIDVGIERPDIFNTAGKYPFFITMSCNTAHFAEPYETGLNELFLMAKRNGSIASYGTSGLGVVGYDEVLSEGMFDAITRNPLATYGEISTYAKNKLIDATSLGNPITRNTVNQYVILGDPATRLPLSPNAELAVRASDIRTTPDIITQLKPAIIKTRLNNFGKCLTDSVDIRLRVVHGMQEVASITKRIEPFHLTTELEWPFDFASVFGTVSISVEIDPAGKVTEAVKTNNTAAITRNILPRGITPIFPLDLAVIPSSQSEITFVLANPPTVPDEVFQPRIEFQVARTPDFNAPLVTLSQPLDSVFTRIEWTPGLNDGTLYWRARVISQSSVEDWTITRSFSFEAQQLTDERWWMKEAGQSGTHARVNAEQLPDGSFILGRRDIELEIVSAGNNNIDIRNFVEMRIDGRRYYSETRSFHVLVLEPVRGFIVDSAMFDTYWSRDNVDAMTAFLRAVPDDHIVMIGIADDAAGSNNNMLTDELKTEMKAFGAALVDSIRFRDSYALIGIRSNPARVREMHLGFGAVIFKDTLNVTAVSGLVRSPVIGPGNEWRTARWEGSRGISAGRIDIAVYSATGENDSLLHLFPDVLPGTELPLSNFPGIQLPYIRFEAQLWDSSGTSSPRMQSWDFTYRSIFPELGINNQSVIASSDSVLEGEPMMLRVGVANAGRTAASEIKVRLSIQGDTQRMEERTLAVIPHGERLQYVDFQLPTAGLRGEWSYNVQLSPDRERVEYYLGNDFYSGRFHSTKDDYPPQLLVTFDDVEIANDDFVRSNPAIDIRVRDKSPLPVTDTSAVRVYLDGRLVWLVNNPLVTYSSGMNGDEKISIRITPSLAPGVHSLAVTAKDASGNPADTIPYQVRFQVSGTNRVDHILPFPNPSNGPMDFTFRVLGDLKPDEGRIKIYTLGGKLIKEIAIDPEILRVGFNRVPWDGRDGEGDAIANGVYFYKLILRMGEHTSEFVERLAILK